MSIATQNVRITLPKPYTLWNNLNENLYLRTGTIITFLSVFWNMPDSFVQANLDAVVEVTYSIPGKKSHSIRTTGKFQATVHNISNLIYHANADCHFDEFTPKELPGAIILN